jgi:hypothetical protein
VPRALKLGCVWVSYDDGMPLVGGYDGPQIVHRPASPPVGAGLGRPPG